MTIVARAEITLIDITDGLISGIRPSNPTEDFLWIDSSKTPNMLMKFQNGSWIELGELDPDASEKIGAVADQLDDMVSDNTVSSQERQMIKDRLTAITGAVILDSANTLPTVSALDNGMKGTFYSVRKSAQYAGIDVSHPSYSALADKYNNLKTYLEGLTPFKPWNTSDSLKDLSLSVNRTTWRDRWLQYVLGEEALQEEIQKKQKQNADDIEVGARNFIRNSTFRITDESGFLTAWTEVNSAFIIEAPEADKPDSSILHITKSGISSSPYYSAYSNQFPAKIGDVFTISLDFKVGVAAEWSIQKPFLFSMFDAEGVRIEQFSWTAQELGITTVQDNTWYRVKKTVTITNANVQTASLRLTLVQNGDIYFRETQVERGNRATDYHYAPEDIIGQVSILEERTSTIEQRTSAEAIVNTLTQSTTYLADMSNKADATALGDYATKGDLDGAKSDLQQYADNAIGQIDLTPFVKSSELSQTVNDITAKFSAFGGVNPIRNSVGFADTNFWTVAKGTTRGVTNSELEQLGFTSGFYSPLGEEVDMEQKFYTTVGQVYTIVCYVKKTVDGLNSHIGVAVQDASKKDYHFLGKGSNTGLTDGYQRYERQFTATTTESYVNLRTGPNGEGIITGLMVNVGDRALQWSQHPEENYSTNAQIDLFGIKVKRIIDGVERGFTRMSPSAFAGYFDADQSGVIDESKGSPDEVFRMDEDEFIMKKAVVKEEITMGNIKVVRIDSGGNSGWAFVTNAN